MSTVFITKTARAHPVASRLALNKRAWVRVCDSAPASANRQKEVEESCQSEFASNRVPHFPIASAQSAQGTSRGNSISNDRPRPHLSAHPVPTSCRNDRVAEKGRGSLLARSQEPLHPCSPPSLFPPLLNMIASTRDGTDNERKVSRCMTCCRAATFSRPTKSTRGLQSLFRRSASRLEAIVNSFPSFPSFGRSFEPRVE